MDRVLIDYAKGPGSYSPDKASVARTIAWNIKADWNRPPVLGASGKKAA